MTMLGIIFVNTEMPAGYTIHVQCAYKMNCEERLVRSVSDGAHGEDAHDGECGHCQWTTPYPSVCYSVGPGQTKCVVLSEVYDCQNYF